MKPKFSIVLHEPEIPGNTGSIGRTCVALGIELVLIKPYGFDINEKSVRRAGLDYWKHLELSEYENWEAFVNERKPKKLFFFSKKAATSYYHAEYEQDCFLVFGSETKGLPGFFRDEYPEDFCYLPMYSDKIRSLNLSNVATTVAYECLRHLLP
jgi:tRNA (cytidine/uridine-2'-O-)-methyltransferase